MTVALLTSLKCIHKRIQVIQQKWMNEEKRKKSEENQIVGSF